MPNNVTNFKYSSSLEDEIKTVNLKWTINDFKRSLQNQGSFTFQIDKQSYKANTDDAVTFQLLIQTKGRENEMVEICYALRIAPIFIKSTLFSIGNGRHTSIVACKNYQWEYESNKWLPLVYMPKQKLERILYQDCLMLEFEFSFNYTGRYDDEDDPEVIHNSTLISDFKELLTSPTLADVKIKSSDGVETDAHKIILIVRSAVFKAHFEHGTTESVSHEIDSPFEMETLKEVLGYIYTDKLPVEDDMLQKLLPAADFYQLDELKTYCVNALRKKLTVENVIDVLQLADLHSAETLKKSCLRFMKGRIGEVIKTDAYKALQLVDLVKSIHDFTLTEDNNT